MELENFRKSLGDEHAHIVEHSYGISKLGLDASWVLFENEDEKDFDEHRPRSKAPRIRYGAGRRKASPIVQGVCLAAALARSCVLARQAWRAAT